MRDLISCYEELNDKKILDVVTTTTRVVTTTVAPDPVIFFSGQTFLIKKQSFQGWSERISC